MRQSVQRLSPIRLAVGESFSKNTAFLERFGMVEASQMANTTTAEILLGVGPDSKAVLANWSEELVARSANIENRIDQGQSKTRAKKHVCSTPK